MDKTADKKNKTVGNGNKKKETNKDNIKISGPGLPFVLVDKEDVVIRKTNEEVNKRTITAKRYKDLVTSQDASSELLAGVTIIGGNRAKKKIINMLEKYRKNESRYREKGIRPDIGIIIYGIPGVGKSELAKQIVREYKKLYGEIGTYDITPAEYLGKRTKSIEVIERAFTKVRQYVKKTGHTAIMIIDEIDALFPKRGRKSTGIIATERTEALLKSIDVIVDDVDIRGKIFIIGTTNLIHRLDPAIFRSGRFHRVAILLPNYKERVELTKMYLENLDIVINSKNYKILEIISVDEVADLTHGFSGADFMTLQKEMYDMMLDKEEKYLDIRIQDITKVIGEHSLNTTNAALMEIAEFEGQMKEMEAGKGTGAMIEEEDVEF